jgi:uncharacterized protein YecE (DUF72 family)
MRARMGYNRPMPGAIHLGTSSWQFDAWRGVFYPEKIATKTMLPFYTSQFDTVEVNTSFYALPRPSTIVDWVETAPPGFTFALKAPRAISHDRKLVETEADSLAYLDTLRALGSAAAPGFLQLPPDFSRKAFGRALAVYLDWIAPRLDGLRLAVEVRAADLMTPAFAAFLAERGLALVLVDRAGQPDLFSIWQEVVEAGSAPAFAFVRWIGDDRNGPKGDRELQTPRDADLERWASRLEWLAQRDIDVYGYVHNPYEGHSPATVRRLRALLGAQVPPPPGDSGQLPLL